MAFPLGSVKCGMGERVRARSAVRPAFTQVMFSSTLNMPNTSANSEYEMTPSESASVTCLFVSTVLFAALFGQMALRAARSSAAAHQAPLRCAALRAVE